DKLYCGEKEPPSCELLLELSY
nr:hypothetical protein [Tanacetum cinerariifolium]